MPNVDFVIRLGESYIVYVHFVIARPMLLTQLYIVNK